MKTFRFAFPLILILMLLPPMLQAQWVLVWPSGEVPDAIYTSPNGAGGTNLYEVTSGRFFRSTDDGASWTPADSGLLSLNAQVTCIASSTDLAGGVDLFAGTNKYGVLISTDFGVSWAIPGCSVYIPVRPNKPCHAIPTGRISTIVAYPAKGGSSTNIIVPTMSAIYLSTDAGVSWSQVNTDLLSTGLPYKLFISAPDGAGGTNLFIGTKGGVYRSNDDGASWMGVDSGLTDVYQGTVTALVAGPNGTGGTNLFAGASSHGSSNGSIYISTDNDTSWNDIGAGTNAATALAVSPNGSGGVNLFAGTYAGHIFLSLDNGTSWNDIGFGLPNAIVTSLTVSDSSLYALTWGASTTDSLTYEWNYWKWPLSLVSNYAAITLGEIGSSRNVQVRSRDIAGKVGNWKGSQPGSAEAKSKNRNLASIQDNGQVLLQWSKDHHPDFMRYHIYADTMPHGINLIDSTTGGVDDTIKVIHGLPPGRTTYFRLTAVDNTGYENNYSNEITAIPGNFIPKPSLTAIPGNGQVLLQWSKDTHADFDAYKIYCDTLPHPVTLIDSMIVVVNDTTKIIQGLTNGTPYYFRIATVDSIFMENDSSMDVPAVPNVFIYSMNIGWNLVSIPLTVPDYCCSVLFPLAISSAYQYEGVYVSKDTLANGCGYWVRLNGSQYVSMNGSLMVQDTINVVEGWNMVGSISTPIPVVNITSDPGGIETSEFFGYSNGYATSDTIQPGHGYWVNISQAGKLRFSASTSAINASHRIRIVPTGEQPPPPPDGKQATSSIPKVYALAQNYPNPFNPTTIIHYDLPKNSHVRLTMYDLLGREVARLVDESEQAGSKSVQFNAVHLSSGIYFYRLTAGTFTETRKLLLLK